MIAPTEPRTPDDFARWIGNAQARGMSGAILEDMAARKLEWAADQIRLLERRRENAARKV